MVIRWAEMANDRPAMVKRHEDVCDAEGQAQDARELWRGVVTGSGAFV